MRTRDSIPGITLLLSCATLVGACGAGIAASTPAAITPPASTAELAAPGEASADTPILSDAPTAPPVREARLPRPTELGLALTTSGSFAVLPSGSVLVWGTLEDGSEHIARATPELLVGLEDVVALAAGAADLCALRVDGTVACLATEASGFEAQMRETRGLNELAFPAPVVGLAVARRHACAVLTDGRVACWGESELGAVGSGAAEVCTVDSDEVLCARAPQLVPGIDDAVVVATGEAHTCALSSDGRVRCWGYGRQLALGVSGVAQSAEPLLVEGIEGARELVSGVDFSCVSDAAGVVSCWGGARQGDFAHFSADDGRQRGELTVLRGAHGLVAASTWVCGVLDEHPVCARRPAGPIPAALRRTVYLSHAHADGFVLDLGVGALGPGTRATAISVALDHACLRDPEGVAHCWGDNSYGAVGDPWADARIAPVPVLRADGEPVPDDERPSDSVPATTLAPSADAPDPRSEWYDYDDIAIRELDAAHYPAVARYSPDTTMTRRRLRAALARDAAALRACAAASPLHARLAFQVTLVPPDTARARSIEVVRHDVEDAALVPCIEAALAEVRWPVLAHTTIGTFSITP